MTVKRSIVLGTGSYLPARRLTNDDLARMVDTSDEWIVQRTGIHARHIAADGEFTSDLAVAAARKALEAAGCEATSIDLIILATATPDNTFPATAVTVQHRLGIASGFAFDVHAVCSGFVYALATADAYLRAGMGKRALVIGAETFSRILDWEDRTTCVLFGDGASAVVLKNDPDSTEPDFVVESKIGAAGIYADLLSMPAGGSAKPASHETVDQHLHSIQMSGIELFKLAVAGLVDSCKEVLRASGVSSEEIAWVIPHQANMRIISAAAQRIDIPVERVYVNIEKYGNTSAASIGICLDELCRGGKLKKGDYILITAFGGGLTWGAMLIRW